MKRTLCLLVVCCSFVLAQTRLSRSQLAIDQEEVPVLCPGPVLERVDDLTLVVGKNWSAAKPCLVNNQVAPLNRDPISVVRLVRPFTIKLQPNQTASDSFYIWAVQPIVPTGTIDQIRLGVVRIELVNGQASQGVMLTPQAAQNRMFPSQVLPIGFAPVESGKFSPAVHSILPQKRTDLHFFIGGNAGMSVRIDDAGYWLEYNPTAVSAMFQQQRIEQAAEALNVARAKAEAANLRMPEIGRLNQIENRLLGIEQLYQGFASRMMPPHIEHALHSLRSELEQVRRESHEFSRVQEVWHDRIPHLIDQVGMLREQLISSRRKGTQELGPSCQPLEWALDDYFEYRCMANGKWARRQFEPLPTDTPAAGQATQVAKKD